MENETKKTTNLFIKHKVRIIKISVIAVALVSVVLLVYFSGYAKAKEKSNEQLIQLQEEVERLSDSVAVYETASKEVNISLINSNIQAIGELATIEYMYTDAGKFENPAKLFGKDIPFSFTTKSFIAKWDGTIKAGIDINQVKAEENKSTKEIIIHIPKAKILSHEIDENSIETLDQNDGLFNPVKVEDVREFDAVSKKKYGKESS